jgi:hypothetical protein
MLIHKNSGNDVPMVIGMGAAGNQWAQQDSYRAASKIRCMGVMPPSNNHSALPFSQSCTGESCMHSAGPEVTLISSKGRKNRSSSGGAAASGPAVPATPAAAAAAATAAATPAATTAAATLAAVSSVSSVATAEKIHAATTTTTTITTTTSNSTSRIPNVANTATAELEAVSVLFSLKSS